MLLFLEGLLLAELYAVLVFTFAWIMQGISSVLLLIYGWVFLFYS